MTTVDEPSRDGRFLMLAGHYETLAWLGMAALQVAYDAAGQPNGTAGNVLAALWVAYFFVLSAGRHHDHRLCERCIAASPLDTDKAVRRWLHALRLSHARRLQIAGIAVMVSWIVMHAVLRSHAWWFYAGDALMTIWVSAAAVARWQHRRLYPWCPFCRWDDGGDHEPSPDVPAPAVSR